MQEPRNVIQSRAPQGAHEGTLPTLEEAKATALAMELEIAANVPAESVVRTWQQTDRVIFRCGDGLSQLAGVMEVTLVNMDDYDDILNRIEMAYRGGPLGISRAKPSAGERITLSRSRYENYIAGVTAKKPEFSISSWSPCFDLGDRSPHATY